MSLGTALGTRQAFAEIVHHALARETDRIARVRCGGGGLLYPSRKDRRSPKRVTDR